MTSDILFCKDHFDELSSTKDNKWLIKELEKGWSGFNHDECDIVDNDYGTRCNKKGYAIILEKEIQGSVEIIGCIKFDGEVI